MPANKKAIGDWLAPALAWFVYLGIMASLIAAAMSAR